MLPWKGIPVYPGLGSTHGNETIHDHATIHLGNLRGGTVLTLMDVWVLDPIVWRQMNVCSWVPVDHEPTPRPVADFFHGTGAVPIAMSRFGEEQLKLNGLEPLYCPHAVDTSVYRPTDDARAAVNLPEDAFIVGMVAANKGNPSRKCFPEAIEAFKRLHDRHPEARLYLHTEATGLFGGVNLPRLIADVGLDLDAVIFPDQYRAVHYPFTAEVMANIYSSFDVLLSPSAGEGFGIPVIEAQAAGVPVIVSDFSAQPELCGSGWLVDGHRTHTAIGSWQFVPDVDDIADALLRAYRAPAAQVEKRRRAAREFALGYDIEHVLAEYMRPALEEVWSRFDDRAPMELVA